MVAHLPNFHAGFLMHLSPHRFFQAFAGFHKAGER